MQTECNFSTLVHLVLVQIIQNVIDVATRKDVDESVSFTIFNINVFEHSSLIVENVTYFPWSSPSFILL